MVLLAGDLSYADGWHARWDTYARMMEPLASSYAVRMSMSMSMSTSMSMSMMEPLASSDAPPPLAPIAHAAPSSRRVFGAAPARAPPRSRGAHGVVRVPLR